MRRLLDKLFPTDQSSDGRSSKLVTRGLDALRLARDHQAVAMGDVRRVPSHLELRISSPLHEELTGIDALKDLAFHLKDEMMKDLAREKGRTFGDHTIHVTIAPDSGLAENEIYALVRNPERSRPNQVPVAAPAPSAPSNQPARPASLPEDATRILSEEPEVPAFDEEDRTIVLGLDDEPTTRLVISAADGTMSERQIEVDKIILGRTGGSDRPLPEGFTKIDLALPKTVSRELVAVTIEEEGLFLERLGTGSIRFADGAELPAEGTRRLSMSEPVLLDGFSVTIERG